MDTLYECKVCGEEKFHTEYYLKKNGKRSGALCKLCYGKQRKKYVTANHDKVKAITRKAMKKYSYPERDTYPSEKECTKCEEVKKISRFYYDKQKNNYQSYCKKCKYEMVVKNPKRKLTRTLRKRVGNVLASYRNDIKWYKKSLTKELLGCDIEIFIDWLKYQMKGNMSIKNHGKVWHIDHCIPCASFDCSKEDEQKRCFHWSNLQPMFKINNLKKGCKIQPKTILNQEIKAKAFSKLKVPKESWSQTIFESGWWLRGKLEGTVN